jgi:hypothetical protein
MSRDEQRRHKEAQQLSAMISNILAAQIAMTRAGAFSIERWPKTGGDKHDS